MWAAARKEPLEAQRRFLAAIPAAEYAALFRESLVTQRRFNDGWKHGPRRDTRGTPTRGRPAQPGRLLRTQAEPTLVSMLECLDTCVTRPLDAEMSSLLLQVLGGLASTRRFELLLMFLDKAQLARVARLFDALGDANTEVPAALAATWGQKDRQPTR